MLNALQGQKFRQRIKLIELTKQLEREPCDSLSFTHRIRSDVVDNSDFVTPDVTVIRAGYGGIRGNIDELYISPFFGSVNIYSIQLKEGNGAFFASRENQVEIYSGWDYNAIGRDQPVYQTIEHDIPETGTWRDSTTLAPGQYFITYYIHYERVGSLEMGTYRVNYKIEVASASSKTGKRIPSITDVINRILSVGQPRPEYKAPKYVLDQTISNKFSDVPAPEFFFPRMTLFEALLEVGKKIHGIPRLIYNETTGKADTITYDLLGLDEEYTIPYTATIVGYKNSHGADDYCGALDSYVENHINTVDPNAGTVTEPFDGGFKTLRCESGVKIVNNTAVFTCDRPIYRVIKFEMAFTSTQTGSIIGDITPYVYEQAEYEGLLTSNAATYPDSIAYALVWKQGDRHIRGFNTTSSSTWNLIEQFLKPSIINIVRNIKGNSGISASEIYSNLAFRLTYIPMDSFRLRQYKPYATDDMPDNDNVLYNQQNANTVEASYYGESLKGKIARMGNEIDVYTVRYRDIEELPKIGNLLVDTDGSVQGYIYKITTKRERNYILADIYVTQDFNRLSEYFSLESNFRLFEVSERQSIDRQVTVPRVIKVSLDEPDIADELKLSTYRAALRFMDTFRQSLSTPDLRRPTVAVCRLMSGNREQIGENCYALPVNSTACGNSLAFSFGFEDSYNAGDRSQLGGTDEIEGQQIEWKQRRQTRYGTVWGSFDSLEFSIADSIYDGNGKHEPTWSDQSTSGGFCDSLPLVSNAYNEQTYGKSYFRTGMAEDLSEEYDPYGARSVDKNSSEKISVVVQFHGQATNKKIVFGSAMWNNNLLIRDDPVKALDADGNPTDTPREQPRVYGLIGKRLNMLRNTIDLSDSAHVVDFGTIQTVYVNDDEDLYGRIDSMTLNDAPDGITAWCIADPTNGEIYIGVNESVESGGSTSPIYFCFDREA